MTQHELNRTEISSVFQEMCCKGMPECVGTDIFIDIYLITAFQMVISADIKSYLENKKGITFSEIFTLLSEKSFYLVSHPFLVLVFLLGSLLLISLDSMILNIPQAGPFFYSITFIIFFLFNFFFIFVKYVFLVHFSYIC